MRREKAIVAKKLTILGPIFHVLALIGGQKTFFGFFAFFESIEHIHRYSTGMGKVTFLVEKNIKLFTFEGLI